MKPSRLINQHRKYETYLKSPNCGGRKFVITHKGPGAIPFSVIRIVNGEKIIARVLTEVLLLLINLSKDQRRNHVRLTL